MTELKLKSETFMVGTAASVRDAGTISPKYYVLPTFAMVYFHQNLIPTWKIFVQFLSMMTKRK